MNLAKRYGHKSSSNFVNAILRKISKKDYEDFFDIDDNIERISKTTSMPVWIIEKLLKEKDIDEVENICKNSNIRPKITVRINKLKTNKEEIKKILAKEKIEFKECELDDFLILEKVKNIENFDLIKNGYLTIQDKGAGLIALVLNPKENEHVLDACSSPGGKTTYMAEMMNNRGEIVAWDIHEHRVNLVEKNAKRLDINIINTECKDATKYEEKYKERFDKILLDVPCLGLGVLKRKPDIKWQRKEEDINEITKIQKEILNSCSKYLKENGELVYSTCSILKDENEEIIKEFLEKNKNFEAIEISGKQQYIQLYQDKENDGFFICKLKKK